MPTDKSGHIAAPIPFTIGGETYLLSTLRLVDLKELENFLKQQPITAIKPQLDGLSSEMQKHLLGLAHEDSKKIRIGTREFSEQSQTFDGQSYMLWLLLRQTRPTMTLTASVALLSDHFDEIVPQMHKAAGFTSDPPAGTTENPTTVPSTSGESTAS